MEGSNCTSVEGRITIKSLYCFALDLPIHSNRSRPINPNPNPLRRNILSGLILVVLGETKESGPISQIVKAAGGTVRVFSATAGTSVEEFKVFMDGILSALLPDKDFVCVRKCSKLPKLPSYTAYLSKQEKDVPIVDDASICTIVVSLEKSSVFKRTFRPLVDADILASPSSSNTKIPAKRSIHEEEAPSSEIIPPTPPTAHAVKLKSRRLSSQDGPQISTKSIYSHYESVVSDVEEENAASPAPAPALGRGGGSNGPSAGQRDTQGGGHESFQTFHTQPEFSALDSFMDDILGLGSGPSSFKPAPAPVLPPPSRSGYVFIAEKDRLAAAAAGSGEGRVARPVVAAQPAVNTRKSWRLGGGGREAEGEGMLSSIHDSPVPPTQQPQIPDVGREKVSVKGTGKRRDWTIPDRLVLDADKEEEVEKVNQDDGVEEEEEVTKPKKRGRAAKAKKGEQEKEKEFAAAAADKKKKAQKSLVSHRVVDPSSIAITVQVTSLFSKKEKAGLKVSTGVGGEVEDHVQNEDGGVGVENFKRFVKNGTVGTRTRILDSSGLAQTTIFQTKLVTVVPATAL